MNSTLTETSSKAEQVVGRVAALDWSRIEEDLDNSGCATAAALLPPVECRKLAALYSQEDMFRSRIMMARHGFGRGEYKYWKYPLPEIVAGFREALYPALSAIANRWNKALGIDASFPAEHSEYLDRCHRHGQTRPTPILLQYGEGDFNCLHQDV